MKKYIDAEKLIERLEDMKRAEYENCGGVNSKTGVLQEVQELISTLQQEQPDNEDIDKVAQELYEHLYELKRRNNLPTNLYDKQEIIDLWKAGIEYAYNHPKQEQPMPDSTKLIELWHEDKEMLKEKDFRDDPWRLAYNAFMCGFGRGIAVNKRVQPEVDAVKDLTLTWEDVKKILKFARASISDALPHSLSNEELAKEVLKRFNEQRKKRICLK